MRSMYCEDCLCDVRSYNHEVFCGTLDHFGRERGFFDVADIIAAQRQVAEHDAQCRLHSRAEQQRQAMTFEAAWWRQARLTASELL